VDGMSLYNSISILVFLDDLIWLLHTITTFESIVPIYWCLDNVFRVTQ
jgi:hypothetical protein